MLAQWCLTAWNMPMGRPNWRRALAYSAACWVHSVARPAASAPTISRARSSSAWRPPTSTSTGAPSSVTRALRRVGSRLSGLSIRTPGASAATTTASSPAARTSRWAWPPPSTADAVPSAFPSCTTISDANPMPPKREPSASPGTRRAATSPGAAASIAALAITVGTKGPGASARPSSSTTTTSSGSPNPDPPSDSGRWRPSQPSSTRSSQNFGSSSVSASSRARAAPRASCLDRKSDAVRARARWSSVMAIGMAGPYLPLGRSFPSSAVPSRRALLSICGVPAVRVRPDDVSPSPPGSRLGRGQW